MNEVDQGLGLLQARPRRRHAPPARRSRRSSASTPTRDLPGELVESSRRKARALTEPEQIAADKLRTGGLYETALHQIGQGRRRSTARCSSSTRSNLLAMRGLERVYTQTAQWPELVARARACSSTSSPRERERIDVLMKIASIQEEQFLKPDLAAVAPRAGASRSTRATRPRSRASSAATGASASGSISSTPTIGTSTRRTIGRRRSSSGARRPRSTPRRSQDLDRAIDAYLNIVDLEDTNIPALDALAKLYEKQDDAAKAIEYMTRVADLTADGKQRVEMYFRIGKQLDEKLGDRVQAQERFEMALDLDPAHLPTLAALRVIAIDSADWDRAARYLDQEQMNTEAPRARAKLLVELGKLRDEMLGEHDAGRAGLRARAPERRRQRGRGAAARQRVRRHASSGRAPSRSPRCSPRRAASASAPSSTACRTCSARSLAALGKNEGALKAYQAAHQLDLTDQETIRGLADVSFKLSDWAGALTNYQKVLTSLGEEETRGARQRLLQARPHQAGPGPGQAGDQQLREGPRARARAPRRRSTRWSPSTTSLKDWKQVCAYKRQILDNVVDGAERFKMLNEIGDIWVDKENNSPKGIEALEEALDLEPQDHVLLHKLLQLYQKTNQWDRMVDMPPAHRRSRDAARAQEPVPLHDGAALPRQARRSRSAPSSSSTRRSISTRASSRPSSASTRSSRR